MLSQINIVKNNKNALKRKDAIHIFFCIAMPILALIFLMQSSLILSPLNMKDPNQKTLIVFTTQFIINHSLDLRMVL
jgi:hypothetical protein